jgi:hypothetical protein
VKDTIGPALETICPAQKSDVWRELGALDFERATEIVALPEDHEGDAHTP